jgi:hypothetical protein
MEEKVRVLFDLYVQELKERGLIDLDLAEAGSYVYTEEAEDGSLLNDAEAAAIAKYRQLYRWLYGDIDDQTYEEFCDLCWREGL